MPLYFTFAGNQINGARDYQEDAYLITHLAGGNQLESALLVVADGMGGHAAGNVASNMAVQMFNQHISKKYPDVSANIVLRESVHKANSAIAETIRETAALQGMGCTLVGIIVEQKGVWWVSVGDSHLYMIRDGKLVKKNEDHSYGGFLDRMKKAGKKVEPQPGMRRNMLMSGVTGDDIMEIDCPEEPTSLKAGDRLIVCSDGMDTLTMGKVLELSRENETPKDMANSMLKAVEDAGKAHQDNTTALVIDIAEKAAKKDEKEEPAPGKKKTVMQSRQILSKAELQAELAQRIRKEQQRAISGGGARSSNTPLTAVVLLFLLLGAGFVFVSNPQWLPKELEFITHYLVPADSTTVPDIPLPKDLPPPPEPALDILSTSDEEAIAQVIPLQDTLKDGGQGPPMIIIPGVTRMMGDISYSGNTNELPQHEVSIPAFAIGKYEVTVDEYNRYAPADKKIDGTGQSPATGITKAQAEDYSRWLSAQTGREYRLPTEAEWEYAAAATTKTAYWWGPRMKPERAHCLFGCDPLAKGLRPVEVGLYPGNPFGLHDTSGNVAEMVADCWHDNYNGAPADGSAWITGGDCSRIVVRGGSYETPEKQLRNSSREHHIARRASSSIGFRVARDLTADEAPPARQQTEQETEQETEQQTGQETGHGTAPAAEP